ncbi:MAG: helix-turn-helix transcriptional regulator [Saprospirales bacterium]|nr:helix-turn-helix transcriptional regulator [Saprospirales bacterium]
MPFNFNIYSSLLLPFVVQGILFTNLLWVRGWRDDRLSDKLLGTLLFLFTLRVANWMLGFAGWYDSHDIFTTFVFYFPFNHWLLMGPLLYFYFRSLTNQSFRIRGKDLWHLAPWLLTLGEFATYFISDVVVFHHLQGNPYPSHYGTQGPLRESGLGPVGNIIDILGYLSLIFYAVWTLLLFRKYRRYVNDHFSETLSIDFSWLRNLLVTVVLAWLLSLVYSTLSNLLGFNISYVQFWYSYFAWGLVIYYLSIQGYFTRQPETLHLQFEPLNTEVEPEPGFIPEVTDPLVEKLLRWMEVHKPYLDPDLTLANLAGKLDVHPNLLSRVLNSAFGKNFNDFINEYRVEALKKALNDPATNHLSLLGKALECGFNSKATFNRAFRKHTGHSPSEFVRTQISD